MAFQPRKCPACGEDDWGVGHQCSSKKVAKKAREVLGDDLVIDEKKRRAMTAHLEVTKMAAKAAQSPSQPENPPVAAKPPETPKSPPKLQQYGNVPVLVRFDDKLLLKLDTMRGDISRQDFIRKLISDG